MMNDISPAELKSRLDHGEDLHIFDVREEWEYDEFNIGGTLLPLPSIPMKLDLIAPLRDEEIILHCQSGKRSCQAKKFLRKNGFEHVRCLIGGVDAFTSME